MVSNPVVDIEVDPLDERRRRRRVLLRIGIPLGGVALMIATILLIAFYADRANRDGALALSDDLLATLEQRIGIEVSAYLEPAARTVRILRDTLHDGALGDQLPLVETFASSLLREIPQIANLNFADENGNFVLVRGGRDGGIDVKLVENAPGPRRVIWIHRNTAGDEIGREEDLTDAYDRFRIKGAGHRVIEVGGHRYISAVTPITSAGRHWSTMIVVPEDDFIGFVASNNRKALWMSLMIVAVTTLLASLLVRQGLRADRGARLLLERQSAITRQSGAFASLASNASLFDPARSLPSRTLTETLADVTGARRASIWTLRGGGRILLCEDSFDRETNGHVEGLELHRDELPGLFRHLLGGEEIEAADAARDRRTVELNRVLTAFGSRALLVVPVRRDDRVVGSVWLEDAPGIEGSRDFVRAVANMMALRIADTSI